MSNPRPPKSPKSKAARPVQSEAKPAAKPGRTRGRRPTADIADLRARLLDAALACFARQGISATSLRDIAAEAEVTPALVHYYFGDKVQLQQAVVAEKLLPVIAQLREPLLQAGDDVAALVAGFVHGVGGIVARYPWLPALWVREVLCEGGALRDVLLHQVGPLVPKMMAARFAEAQQHGKLNPDLDPRLLMVSLVGLTFFPLASAPIWRALFGAQDVDFDALRQHTLVLLDRGLELEHAQ
ncbi:MAG TPA: TetR/AcrR family transcriptional regulator [Pseudoxanthomonas sp.]|nr:TetR/AcrR family transcriptional regulator [Pseudoxanthomonas sp.]